MRPRRRLLGVALLAVLLAGCQQRDTASPTTTSGSPVPTSPEVPTTATTLSPEAEVRAAYLRQWDVYAGAVRHLDTSKLGEVFAGPALQTVRAEIQRRRRQGRPAAVKVQHHITSITLVNPTTAVVLDRYRNHSVRLDPATGRPAEPDPNEVIEESYAMKLVRGAWKVTEITRRSTQ
jgi:hypothetical protein